MERVVRVFDSHAEAAAADRAFYRSLSPQERLNPLLELAARHREGFGEAATRSSNLATEPNPLGGVEVACRTSNSQSTSGA